MKRRLFMRWLGLGTAAAVPKIVSAIPRAPLAQPVLTVGYPMMLSSNTIVNFKDGAVYVDGKLMEVV